jgi:hypothetical protein
MTNQQTVRDVYAAFQRVDVATILAQVTGDGDWRNDDVASKFGLSAFERYSGGTRRLVRLRSGLGGLMYTQAIDLKIISDS